MSRKGSASELKNLKVNFKNLQNQTSSDSKNETIYECDVCKSEVEDGDDALECVNSKVWFHISCVDITTCEYEVSVRYNNH